MAQPIRDAREIETLGEFVDPKSFTGPLDITGLDISALLKKLRMMLLIRRVEEVIAEQVQTGEAKCPCHLGIGQEAVAVGISNSLRASDKVFGAHRSHAHYLALGAGVYELFAEVFGRTTGCSKGMGGSMHLQAVEHGFIGSVPIVAATIPIATGAALALQLARTDNIAVSYFGDGAAEEGAFHESMNFAAVKKLPVLFVCENNLFASHMDIGLRQPSDAVSRYAVSHRMPALVVDGNDIASMMTATAQLVERIRQGQGPAFIEAVTYRWRGHVGPNEDIDVGVRRKPGDLTAWKHRDPVARLLKALRLANVFSDVEFQTMQSEVHLEIQEAVERALRAPFAEPNFLLQAVYGPAPEAAI